MASPLPKPSAPPLPTKGGTAAGAQAPAAQPAASPQASTSPVPPAIPPKPTTPPVPSAAPVGSSSPPPTPASPVVASAPTPPPVKPTTPAAPASVAPPAATPVSPGPQLQTPPAPQSAPSTQSAASASAPPAVGQSGALRVAPPVDPTVQRAAPTPVSPIKQAPPAVPPKPATPPAPNTAPVGSSSPPPTPPPAQAPQPSVSKQTTPAPTPKAAPAPPVDAAAVKAAAATPSTPLVGGPLPAPPAPAATATAVKTATPPPQTVTALSSVSPSNIPTGAATAPVPATPPPAGKPTEVTSSVKEKKKFSWKLIPIIVGVLLVVLLGAFYFLFMRGNSSTSRPSTSNNTGGGSGSTTNTGSGTTGQKVVLQYWGLWEQSDVMKEVLDEYTQAHPNVSVQYTMQSHKDYRTRLQTALSSGNGPDIFRYHASWVPMFASELSSLPSAVMSTSEYQSTFYPVASQQLQSKGSLVGIPLMYEGLALFYNTDALATAVVQPPTTWGEVRAAAQRLTIREGEAVKRAGIAMGYTSNVDNYADILALLALQNGADLSKPNSKQMMDALTFYSLFAEENVWSEALPASTVAFARGDVAMIFAPSWRAHEIKLMNPNLKFATMPVPQLDQDKDKQIAWASFWAEGVSSKSKYQKESWEFLKYLSSKEVQMKLHSDQAQTRSFGEIYSRVDLANELAADPVIGAFVADAPKAQGWYMSSMTHDVGINDEIITYVKDVLNQMVTGKKADAVIEGLSAGINQVLQKYSVVAAPSATPSTR